MTMFATFAGFCGCVVMLTESVNKLFKVDSKTAKFVVSWVVSIGLACLGFVLQYGIFADLGAPAEWQGWVKTVFIGVFCAVCSNRTYDMNEIWRVLQIIFSFFDKDGKAKRAALTKK